MNLNPFAKEFQPARPLGAKPIRTVRQSDENRRPLTHNNALNHPNVGPGQQGFDLPDSLSWAADSCARTYQAPLSNTDSTDADEQTNEELEELDEAAVLEHHAALQAQPSLKARHCCPGHIWSSLYFSKLDLSLSSAPCFGPCRELSPADLPCTTIFCSIDPPVQPHLQLAFGRLRGCLAKTESRTDLRMTRTRLQLIAVHLERFLRPRRPPWGLRSWTPRLFAPLRAGRCLTTPLAAPLPRPQTPMRLMRAVSSQRVHSLSRTGPHLLRRQQTAPCRRRWGRSHLSCCAWSAREPSAR